MTQLYSRVIPANLRNAVEGAIDQTLRDAAQGKLPGWAISDDTGEVVIRIETVDIFPEHEVTE